MLIIQWREPEWDYSLQPLGQLQLLHSQEHLAGSIAIPLDNKNVDYQAILAWVEAGNTIAAAD